MSPVKVVGIIKRAMHWRKCSLGALGGSGEIVKPLFFFFVRCWGQLWDGWFPFAVSLPNRETLGVFYIFTGCTEVFGG